MFLLKYLEFINESSAISLISNDDIDDIMVEITDIFDNITYDIENSNQSSLIEPSDDSFIITLYEKKGEDFFTKNRIYYLEPRINEIVEIINKKFQIFGLYISKHDYGMTNQFYELVITKIGKRPIIS